ncbi:MAG: septum formation family protein [Nitriliruptoraceae bacterium]
MSRVHLLGTVTALVLLPVACGPPEGSVAALAVGDCFDEPAASAALEEVPVVACDEPHRFEVIGAVLLDDDAQPGPALEEEAVAACAGSFSSYVGVDPEDSELRQAALVPTAAGWADGDREALCLVTDPTGSLVGSVAGAGR